VAHRIIIILVVVVVVVVVVASRPRTCRATHLALVVVVFVVVAITRDIIVGSPPFVRRRVSVAADVTPPAALDV